MKNYSKTIRRARKSILQKVKRKSKALLKKSRRLEWYFTYRIAPPSVVAIETNTSCNRTCAYCPNSLFDRGAIKNNTLMSVELYTKIMQDLKEMGFTGKLSAQFYNEPLLDERLPDLLGITRNILGDQVALTSSTNGDLLNESILQKFHQLGFARLTISIHDSEPSARLSALLEKVNNGSIPSPKLHVKYLKNFKGYWNRGGLIDISPYVDRDLNQERLKKGCNKATHMQIDALGRVILCCNDYHSDYTLGLASEERLRSIWKRSLPLRKQIFLGDYRLDICRKCADVEGDGIKPLDHPLIKKEGVLRLNYGPSKKSISKNNLSE